MWSTLAQTWTRALRLKSTRYRRSTKVGGVSSCLCVWQAIQYVYDELGPHMNER